MYPKKAPPKTTNALLIFFKPNTIARLETDITMVRQSDMESLPFYNILLLLWQLMPH
jgi:hypothetical protein